jgi:HKD family nuclease
MKLISTPDAFKVEFKRLMKHYAHFDWAVAWASINFEPFELLKKYRQKVRHIVIGTEFHQTHPDFIEEFSKDAGVRFRIDQEALNGVFHPKVYLFSNSESSWEAVVGSANFTKSAFSRNVEYAVLFGSADEPEGFKHTELFKQIEELWKAASPINEQTLISYRFRWKANRRRLAAVAGHNVEKIRRDSVYDCMLLNLEWPEYFKQIQNEQPQTRFNDRLKLLQGTHEIFTANQSLVKMTLDERKKICGTAVEDEVKWRLFGSMAGSIVLKKRIADNDLRLSEALDLIPAVGPVSKEHYDDYVSNLRKTFVYEKGFQGLAVATRLLCIKRPDHFVCIDGKNINGVTKALGLNPNKLKIDTYWDAVIEPIMESPWYQSNPSPTGDEKIAWNFRGAMIDALFYKP